MKKRTKITLRTKIYLTIVGLLALTGVFYAANPSQLATVPKSVAARLPWPIQLPLPCSQGRRRGRCPGYCARDPIQRNQNLSRIDCDGNVTSVATIPGPVRLLRVEKYMAIAPIQSTAAGFTPRDVFITQGDDIYKFSGGIVTPFATVGCPFSDHSSITFDHVGTFGNNMIVTCENGPVFTINGPARWTTCHANRDRTGRRTLKDQL